VEFGKLEKKAIRKQLYSILCCCFAVLIAIGIAKIIKIWLHLVKTVCAVKVGK